MILPLAAVYVLFAWIQSYHNDQKVSEYFQMTGKLQTIISVLDNPDLYKPNIERPDVDQLVHSEVSIALFNPNGLVLYSSDPAAVPIQFALNKEALYENLYSLEQGYRSFDYKQPVFAQNELVGFFEVQLAREEWVTGVENRSWYILGLFIMIFALIFLVVAVLVNRKLNKRLKELMGQMTSFANDQVINETPMKKDEIGELTAHFYAMKKQIEAAREAIEKQQQEKEYMIATISHDLKTPLTSIRAYAELLTPEQKQSDYQQLEYRTIIIEKANYMKQMLDDLLMYTLLQSPTYELEFVEVDGSEFFEMLVEDYEPLCKNKKLQLAVHCQVTGNYELNPKQMMRVADNLVSNAIQHSEIGGQLWIGAFSSNLSKPGWLFDFMKDSELLKAPNSVFFIVQNRGKGIPKDKIVHLFEPLFQVDQARSKRDARGTGLGLSITKQVIEKHHGTVQVFSHEEIGTCVVCRLPKIKKEGVCNEF
nr:HAMP domain-containing sensor histidine kinase [Bacillus sp. B15-48]